MFHVGLKCHTLITIKELLCKPAPCCVSSSSFWFIKGSSRSQLCVFDFFLTNSRGQWLLARCLVSCVLWGNSLLWLVSVSSCQPAAQQLPVCVKMCWFLTRSRWAVCSEGNLWSPVSGCRRAQHLWFPPVGCGVVSWTRADLPQQAQTEARLGLVAAEKHFCHFKCFTMTSMPNYNRRHVSLYWKNILLNQPGFQIGKETQQWEIFNPRDSVSPH